MREGMHHACSSAYACAVQVVAQFALNAVAGSTAIGDRVLTQAYDQKARAHARTVVRLWAAKGYQPVYLSGRQVRTPPLRGVRAASPRMAAA